MEAFMNRKQGQQSSRNQSSSLNGRGAQQSRTQNSQYGQNYGHSQDQDEMGMARNFSGASSYNDDSYESGMGAQSSSNSSYRDTDYDLDGSTYGGTQNRGSARSLSGRGTQGDYELSDRYNRDQTRFSSSMDEDRSYRPSSERYGQSSERFGYPSSMNSWRGNDRSTGAGSRSGAGRMGQSNFNSWGASQAHDEDSFSGMNSGSRAGMGSQFGSQSEMGMGAQGQGQSSSWGASQGNYYGEGSLGNDYRANSHTSDYGSYGSSSERGHFGKGPKGWKRSDDRIKEDVCETLARHPRIDASDIDVKVEGATVTLSGTVDSKEIKRAAEMAIENLSGVDDVTNEIKVKKMGERGMDSTMHASSSGSSTSGTNASVNATNSKSTSSKGSSHL